MAKKWNEEKARDIIVRTNGVVSGKQIWHPKPGLAVLGAIDFLIKKHNYTRVKDM